MTLKEELQQEMSLLWDEQPLAYAMKFLQGTDMMFIINDRNRRYLHVNDNWLQRNQMNFTDVVGRSPWNIFGDVYYERYRKKMDLAFEEGRRPSPR